MQPPERLAPYSRDQLMIISAFSLKIKCFAPYSSLFFPFFLSIISLFLRFCAMIPPLRRIDPALFPHKRFFMKIGALSRRLLPRARCRIEQSPCSARCFFQLKLSRQDGTACEACLSTMTSVRYSFRSALLDSRSWYPTRGASCTCFLCSANRCGLTFAFLPPRPGSTLLPCAPHSVNVAYLCTPHARLISRFPPHA